MKRSNFFSQVVLLVICSALLVYGQAASSNSNSIVPRLVKFNGSLTDINGKPLTGTVGVTFSLYKESDGGTPLWIETQNVQPDSKGHYTVLLGSTKSDGVSTDLFTSGEARWLGVQAQGQAEQARVLMVSVPYALKAVDADTLGGKPASAFQLVPSQPVANPSSARGFALGGAKSGNPNLDLPIFGRGEPGFIPLWTGNYRVHMSVIQQGASSLRINDPVEITGSTSTGPLSVYGGSTTGALWVNGGNNSAATAVTVKEQNGLGISVQGGGEGTGINVVEDSGVGINVGAYKLGTGIVVNKGSMYGLIANGQAGIAVQGSVPYNNRTSLEAVLGSSWTDNPNCPILSGNDGCAGVVGAEYGSTNDTVGVYGYTASSVGAGVYGQSVGPSLVAGTPPDPSAGVWGDSSLQTGVQGTSDVSSAFYGENNTGGSTYATGWLVNDSVIPGDLVVEADGGTGSSCTIDINGNLRCLAGSPGGGGVSAAYLSTGGGNTDMAGICAIGTGGVCTQTFIAAYTNPPVCVVADPAGSGVTYVVATTSLTINGTSGHQANYVCVSLDSLPPGKKGHGHHREHPNPAVHAGSPRPK